MAKRLCTRILIVLRALSLFLRLSFSLARSSHQVRAKLSIANGAVVPGRKVTVKMSSDSKFTETPKTFITKTSGEVPVDQIEKYSFPVLDAQRASKISK